VFSTAKVVSMSCSDTFLLVFHSECSWW